MKKIACSHPGKIGDAIYSLPAIRKACEMEKAVADFYTSAYCKPMKRLFEYQEFINGFYIPDNYEIERMDMGVQPYIMPINTTEYERVFQMGFRWVPDRAIPDFIALSVGIPLPVDIEYDYPEEIDTIKEPYIVVAPRGETSYKNTFIEFINLSPIPCVIVGGCDDYVGIGTNMCGIDLLETTSIIAKSVGFVGLMSSQLALANGFNIPKVAPHDGIHWDMRHVVYSDTNFYPINPTPTEILRLLNI